MSNNTFIDRVTNQFGYLETDYSFHMKHAKNSDIRPQTDGIVKYVSDSTAIIIDSETAQVSVRFTRIQDDENHYLDPVSIYEYLHTSEKEKKILLSRSTKDKDTANKIFRKIFLLSSPAWKNTSGDVHNNLDRRLKNYANWLRENATLCLTGDFSRWPEFYEYKINRLVANELQGGGNDVVFAVVKDEAGKLKTIERPIFQREQDFLLRLKKEILENG